MTTQVANFCVINFYHFVPLSHDEITSLREFLLNLSNEKKLIGLVLLAPEGINATVVGSGTSINSFKEWLRSDPRFKDVTLKESTASKAPFRRFKVDLRKEIITFGHPVATSGELKASLISPEQWEAKLEARKAKREDFLLLDVRNKYETELGMFKDAVDPSIDVFTELPQFLEKQDLPKDKEILMYCTGGVRCEKALRFFHEKGFRNVLQLEGGILSYLEQFPNRNFDGECFVFDHRVAVDQELNPSSQYHLCVHCGDPGQIVVNCKNCGKSSNLCARCEALDYNLSCSKNCAYHLRTRRERSSGNESNNSHR